MRILVRDLAAMRRELVDPKRINPRHGARKELGSLDDFTRDDPLRLVRLGFRWRLAAFEGRLLPRLAARVKRRARENRNQPVACRLVAIDRKSTRLNSS